MLSRPHPFLYYRATEQEQEQEEADDEKVVHMFFDGKAAMCLNADGLTARADQYIQGEQGFIVAKSTSWQ